MVHLSGTFVKVDEDCDKLRFRAQLWQTVLQFPEVKRVDFILESGIPLGDFLYVPGSN